MKAQKFKIYTIVIFSLFGCEDFLDVEPIINLPIEVGYNSQSDMEVALNGAYTGIKLFFVKQYYYNTLMGDNIIQSNANFQIQNMSLDANDGNLSGIWREGYKVINSVNTLLTSLDNVEWDNEVNKNKIEGQALFLRALVYFELVKYFGKQYSLETKNTMGVPLYYSGHLEFDDFEPQNRSTVEEVYNSIEKDLNEAIELLPNQHINGYIRQNTAKAILAKVKFQKEDYESALTYCNELIQGNYSLQSSIFNLFGAENEFSQESVFELEFDNTDNNVFIGAFYVWGLLTTSEDFSGNAFSETILPRHIQNLNEKDYSMVDDRKGFYKFRTYEDNIFKIRLAELMLMKAECLVRTEQSISAEAIDLLNKLRARAIHIYDESGIELGDKSFIYYIKDDFATYQELIEAIIKERRVELVMELNRSSDLLRLKKDIKGHSNNSDMIVWPIPNEAILYNDLLQQNPGY